MLVGALTAFHGAVRELGELAFVADQHRQRMQAGEGVDQARGVAADAVVAPRGDVAAVDDDLHAHDLHANCAIASATAAGAS